jgi:hypothetical protein
MTLTRPAPGSLEAWRETAQGMDRDLTTQKLKFARVLYAMWREWDQLYRGSRREFIQWFNEGQFSGSHYAYLYSGQAQAAGFSAHRSSVLAQIGQALSDGDTPADIQARLDEGHPPRRPQRTVTTLQIPAVLAPQLREIVRSVSDSDTLNGPEAAARIIQAIGNQLPPLRAALLDTEGTGRPLVDALVYAVDQRSDYRSALAQQGCLICQARPVQLHHMKVGHDDRNRTNTVFAALCERHHIARPGDSTDAIHAMTIDTIQATYPDFWQRVAVSLALAAEASRPEKENA